MSVSVRLDEDWHVHSTFSDGADTVAANVQAAESLGLTHLGCVDHVRRDTTYVPDYVAALLEARRATAVTLSIGIEAKILTAGGELDLPVSFDGVDLIYIADHQFPGADGPVSPRIIREALAAKTRSADEVARALGVATVAAMERNAPGAATGRAGDAPGLVLAHLFSIVPKLGIDESEIPDEVLDAVARAAAATGTIVEISERWRCPSARMVARCVEHGVRIVASTDSHRSSDIARYAYVAEPV